MTRMRMLAAAASLATLALRPAARGQAESAEGDESRIESIERRLASIERVFTERSTADATPAARALDSRLMRIEMGLERLEREVWNLRNRVGR